MLSIALGKIGFCLKALFLTLLLTIPSSFVNGQNEAKEIEYSVSFQGNFSFSSEQLVKELAKCPFNLRRVPDEDRFKNYFERCLSGTVFFLYQSNGFWTIREKSQIRYDLHNDKRTINVSIIEPPLSTVGKIEVLQSTNRLLSGNDVRKWLKLRDGDIADISQLVEFRNKILAYYFEHGYLGIDIEIDSNLNSDNTRNPTIEIQFRIIEGEPFIISEINFERTNTGYVLRDERLTDDFLRRTFGLHSGEVYSESKLQEGLARLNKLGDFRISNSRVPDMFSLSTSDSSCLSFEEDYDNHTVKIIVFIPEPFYSGDLSPKVGY